MEEFNLKTDRADVIVPAAEIFLIIAGIVKAEYIHVPVIGLADGIIDNLYAIYLKTEQKELCIAVLTRGYSVNPIKLAN